MSRGSLEIDKNEENALLHLGWIVQLIDHKKVLLVLITQWSTMEFQRYANIFYYFGNIKIKLLEKETIKRIIADVWDAICYSSINKQRTFNCP